MKKTGTERDLFARSAYNRYYYAVFLSVRSMVTELDNKWALTRHKSYPDLLKVSISKNLKIARWRAGKNNDSELYRILDSGIRAASALAILMEQANGARVVADYNPSEAVNFVGGRFSLKSIEITEAHGWYDSVRILTNSIKNAWRQANV